ncbi:carbohydrate-binding module family 50 protein [Pleomassaria siparia CBS 279.74]|uniref:Carbohydrate-binding module family 50 protein n=1 Tax=Pleomassaria siparia CBS 279.74 TaxID=1314801 RepID=A0A6G1K047_9PLEO|nr:carbohydrate-binding module family 50 protein [Pleomassaria siparia CBS 279.74]
MAFTRYLLSISLYLLLATPLRVGVVPILNRRQTTTGFTLVPDGALKGAGLGATCEQVLYQNINCNNFTKTLDEPKYHPSLNDTALTKSVCAPSCGTALANARRRVSGACTTTPELFPGFPVLALIDKVYTGWNETCLKDNTTSAFCNDIINSWTPVANLEDMPKSQLCSYCYGAKLMLMRSSPYSGYDQPFAVMLDYVNKNCGGTAAPSQPLPNPVKVNETSPVCSSGKTYKTGAGDTCDSVALANSVSSATLFYTNPNLLDCANIREGLTLCLPLGCQTYTVKTADKCVAVAVVHSSTWQDLVVWNAGIDAQCSNLYGATPSFGTTICVSPPGGKLDPETPTNSTLPPGNGNTGGHGGNGDGYANEITNPPAGTVATGTTSKCGDYIQAHTGTGCAAMIAPYAIMMDLFLAVNPSLKSVAECSSNIRDGVWYCLHPVKWWNKTASTDVSIHGLPESITAKRVWVPLDD